MELYEAIEKRRTIRDFLDKPVSMEIIKKDYISRFESSYQQPFKRMGICYYK